VDHGTGVAASSNFVIEYLCNWKVAGALEFNYEIARLHNHKIEASMYHYDPNTALEELTEDATLPNPVHVRDMILRKKLTADQSLELNRLFVEYQKFFGEAQKLGKEILKQLAA
jgi:hypothetical protein